MISTPDLKEGQTVVLSSGGTDQLDAEGFSYQGAWNGGGKLAEITISGPVTKVSEDGSEVTGMGGFGQRGRRNHQETGLSSDPLEESENK